MSQDIFQKLSLVDQFLPVPGCVKLLLLANWKWSYRDLFFCKQFKTKMKHIHTKKVQWISSPVSLPVSNWCHKQIQWKANNKFWNQQKFSWSVSLCSSLCEIDVISKYTGKPVRKAPQVLGKPSKEHHRCLVNQWGKHHRCLVNLWGKHHRCLVNLAKSTTGAWST